MNRRGFLKMLGLAVPAVVVAPIAVAESTPEFQMGYGNSYPGMPLSRGRVDLLEMHQWQRAEFDKDPLFGGTPREIDQAAAWENAGIAIQSIFPVGGR